MTEMSDYDKRRVKSAIKYKDESLNFAQAFAEPQREAYDAYCEWYDEIALETDLRPLAHNPSEGRIHESGLASQLALAEALRRASNPKLIARDTLTDELVRLYTEARSGSEVLTFRSAGTPATAHAAYHEDVIISVTDTTDAHLNVRWNDQRIMISGGIVSEIPCDILIVLETEGGIPVGLVPVQYDEPSISVDFPASDTDLNPTVTRWQIRILPLGRF